MFSKLLILTIVALTATTSFAQSGPSGPSGPSDDFKACDDNSTPTCPDGTALDLTTKHKPCTDGKPVCADGTIAIPPPHHGPLGNHDLDNINSDVNTLLHKYHNVVYAAATLVGFVFTFVGYKLFPATMFLAGSAAGGIGSYILTDSVVDDTYIHKVAIIVGVSVTCALIAGVLALKLRKLGVFLAGAFGGVVGAVALNNAFLINYTSPIVSVPNFYLYVAAVLLGSIAGVLALKLERPILILTTSVVGSFCTVYGTKYFIELEKVVPVTSWSSPQVWIYLSAFLVLLIAGLLIQFSSTKKPRNLNGERRTSLLANDYSSVHIESKNAIVYVAPNNNEGKPSSGSIITSV